MGEPFPDNVIRLNIALVQYGLNHGAIIKDRDGNLFTDKGHRVIALGEENPKIIHHKPNYKRNGKNWKISDYFQIDGEASGFYQKCEIREYVRKGYEITFLPVLENKPYTTWAKSRFSKEGYFLALIESNKDKESVDTELCRRIINNGGMVRYIEKLEKRLKGEK